MEGGKSDENSDQGSKIRKRKHGSTEDDNGQCSDSSQQEGAIETKPGTRYIYQDLSSVEPNQLDLIEIQGQQDFVEIVQQKLPVKLNSMLRNPDLASAIRWQPHGRSFKIGDRKKLASEVLPIYFGHSNLDSFFRLINAWGFRRYPTGVDRGSYYHELFLRGMPHLHARMKRLTKDQIKTPVEYEDRSPDFYSMPLPDSLNSVQRDNAHNSSPFLANTKSNIEEKKAVGTKKQDSSLELPSQNKASTENASVVGNKITRTIHPTKSDTNTNAQNIVHGPQSQGPPLHITPNADRESASSTSSAISSTPVGKQKGLPPSIPATSQIALQQQQIAPQNMSQTNSPLSIQLNPQSSALQYFQIPSITGQSNPQMTSLSQLLSNQGILQSNPSLRVGDQLVQQNNIGPSTLSHQHTEISSPTGQQLTRVDSTVPFEIQALLDTLRSLVEAHIQTPVPRLASIQIIDIIGALTQNQSQTSSRVSQTSSQPQNQIDVLTLYRNWISTQLRGNDNSSTATYPRSDDSSGGNKGHK